MPSLTARGFCAALVGTLVLLSCAAISGCQSISGYANNRMGKMAFESGNYQVAKAHFHRAVIDQPNNTNYRANLAAAQFRQGCYRCAEKNYRFALRRNRTHQASYHGLAKLLHTTGRTGDAYALLENWSNSQPRSEAAHVEMAWFKQEMGDTLGAESSLRQALSINPNNGYALAQMGQMHENRGQVTSARRYYQQSLAKNWRQPVVRKRLAMLQRGYRHTVMHPAPVMTAAISSDPVPMRTPTPLISRAPRTLPSNPSQPLPVPQLPPVQTKVIAKTHLHSVGKKIIQASSTTDVKTPAELELPILVAPAKAPAPKFEEPLPLVTPH